MPRQHSLYAGRRGGPKTNQGRHTAHTASLRLLRNPPAGVLRAGTQNLQKRQRRCHQNAQYDSAGNPALCDAPLGILNAATLHRRYLPSTRRPWSTAPSRRRGPRSCRAHWCSRYQCTRRTRGSRVQFRRAAGAAHRSALRRGLAAGGLPTRLRARLAMCDCGRGFSRGDLLAGEFFFVAGLG